MPQSRAPGTHPRRPEPPRGRPVWFVAALVTLCLSAAARAEDPVLVNITGPLAAKLGEKVSFEVELVNRSGQPLTGLRVVDYFDKGFHHEASASPIEQRGTIDMAAGTSRRLTLDFLTDEPGRQCHRVEILDQAHNFMGGATECVLVTAPAAPAVATAPATVPGAVVPGATVPNPALAVPATTVPPRVTTPALPGPTVATPAPVPPRVPVPVPTPSLAAPTTPAPVATPTLAAPTTTLPSATLPATTSIPPLGGVPMTAPAATVPSLELDLAGPNELADAAVGQFVATVRNTGTVPSGPTKLEFDWDPAYAALEASDGYVLGTNSVTWTIPPLEPGGQTRRQINLRAQSPAGARGGQVTRACVRGVLSESVGGVMVADESCVAVRSTAAPMRTPREAGMRLSVADTADPVVAGGQTTLVCTVTNNGGAPSGKLRLIVELPQGATLVGDPVPSRVGIEGRVLSFDGIASIPPGGHATFEASYRVPAGAAGARAVATASLSGDQLDGRMETDCSTTFLAP